MKNSVSIIIPSYNAEKFLNNTLESVLNQKFEDWKCIIINDGSQDNTENICENWVKKDNRFSYFTQENKGLSGARNTGISKANCEYIFFLDADDLLPSNSIYDLITSFSENSDFTIGITAKRDIISGEILGEMNHFDYNKIKFIDNNKKQMLLKVAEEGHCVIAMNKLYKKSFIEKHNLRFKQGILHEDYLWFFQTIFFSKKISFCNSQTYFYHVNNNESITNNKSDKNILDLATTLDILYQDFYKNKKYSLYKNQIGTYISYFKRLITNEVKDIKAEVSTKFFFEEKINKTEITSKRVSLFEKLILKLNLT